MRKTILLALCASLLLCGCQLFDSMFFNADSVAASSLGSYASTNTASPTKTEALQSTATILYAYGGAVASSAMSGGTVPMKAIASVSPTTKALGNLVSPQARNLLALGTAQGGRTISQTTNSDLATGIIDYTATFKDETYDLGTAGKVLLNGKVSAKATGVDDVMNRMPPIDCTIKLDSDMKASANLSGTSAGINSVAVNLKAKIDGSVKMASATSNAVVKAYTAIAINGGFSVDDIPDYGITGGKYLFSFRAIESLDSSVSTTTSGVDSALNEVSADITVKIYDNANKLLASYTYTPNEVAAMAPAAP